MQEYPFAHLDNSDLAELRSLESRLANKLGKPIILIAYEHTEGSGNAQSLTALKDDAEPEDYGMVQSTQETGLYV